MIAYTGSLRGRRWKIWQGETLMAKPIMARATVWLVENTTMTFKQIADFVGMHELEIQGIADGDVAN